MTQRLRSQWPTALLFIFPAVYFLYLHVNWFPEPDFTPKIMPPKPKLNVQSFPRPPLLEKIPRHILIKYQNHTIAETRDAYWALETHHPPSNLPPLHHSYCISKNNRDIRSSGH